MFGSHPSSARRVDRWLDRWGRAFVMEVETRDGARFLLGLEPNWHGTPTLALVDDDRDDDGRADADRDGSWTLHREVDQVMWIKLDNAHTVLSYDHDIRVVAGLTLALA